MPRSHHFKAKHLIAAMAVQSIDKFLERFSPPDGEDYFRALWGGLGLDLPEEERVGSDGLSVMSRELKGGHSALILTLPEPQERNEAYFLAALQPQPGVGLVVGLERSLDPMTQEPMTALVGWSTQGRFNCGKSPQPDLASFILEVEELLA
ncbi:hypothetical protein [Duganella sp. Root1480D1]|uniref:hypothetical protein n=1 Tax=Duganella sp. Root1480D1 TaxID=1736471 RepID=UPI00071372CC|nr:hypothetical protein [Duganella sp. Root1480D1]KQZ30484.1 hypothetical protein ASD58_10775 [Duganella sp. Root1480D1]